MTIPIQNFIEEEMGEKSDSLHNKMHQVSLHSNKFKIK